MKRFAQNVLAGLALGALMCLTTAPSCAHVTPVAEDCSAEAAGHLLDDVNTVIATGDWKQGLADLVQRFGGCVIEKAVAEIAKQAGVRAQYDQLEATKAERARQWLAERGKPVAAAMRREPDVKVMVPIAPRPSLVICYSTYPEQCEPWDGVLSIDWDLVVVDWPTQPTKI